VRGILTAFAVRGAPPEPSPIREGNPDRNGVAFSSVSFQSIGNGLTTAFRMVSFVDGSFFSSGMGGLQSIHTIFAVKNKEISPDDHCRNCFLK
jgi:hypothetical protein